MGASNLKILPRTEATIRGADGVRIAREMMAEQGYGWDRIPDHDKLALTQSVIGLGVGLERSGWRLTRPTSDILSPYAHFLAATPFQVAQAVAHMPDRGLLGEYHLKLVSSVLNAMLAAMSRLGWSIIGPQNRKPTVEGGYREGIH